jgi:hypothetical protein
VKKNYKDAIITLIGGMGVLPILMAIFGRGMLDFGYAIVIAFSFFLISGVLNGLLVETEGEPGPLLLRNSQKDAILTLVGGMGVIVILMSIFGRGMLDFGYAIVIAYGIFLITGTLNILIEERPSKTKKEEIFSNSEDMKGKSKIASLNLSSTNLCSSCGYKLEKGSIFCTNCGSKLSSGF